MDEYGSQVEIATRRLSQRLDGRVRDFVADLAPDVLRTAAIEWLSKSDPALLGLERIGLDDDDRLVAYMTSGETVTLTDKSLRGRRGRGGERGPAGIAGLAGPRGDIGPPGESQAPFEWRGSWKRSMDYAAGSIVDLSMPMKDAAIYYTTAQVQGARPPAAPWRRMLPRQQVLQDMARTGGGGGFRTHAISAGKLINQTVSPALTVVPLTWITTQTDGTSVVRISDTTYRLDESAWYSIGAHISATDVAAGTVMGIETTINGSRALSTYRTYLPIPGDTIDDDYNPNDRYFAAGTTLAIAASSTDASITIKASRCSLTIRKVAN